MALASCVLASLVLAASEAVAASKLRDCRAPASAYAPDPFYDWAAGDIYNELGVSRRTAARWGRTQMLVNEYLEPAIRRTPGARGHYRDQLAFADSPLTVQIGMRTHEHDRAIRACARRLKIGFPVRTVITPYSQRDLDRAADKFAEPVRDLWRLFEIGQSPFQPLQIAVYRAATPEDRARFRTAAAECGAICEVREVDHDRPVTVDD